jgi:hypothetical protein
MLPCQCQPTESPFTCSRSGCTMTARQHELCSGVNCTARQHVKHARLFARQRCGGHIGDVNKLVDHVPDVREMVGDQLAEKLPRIPRKVRDTRRKPEKTRQKQPVIRKAPPLRKGPGSHLKAILAELGVTERICGCNEYAAKMDKWGVEECRMRRPEIVAHLNSAATWRDKITVAVGAARTLALWLNPLDAAGSLLDEACRRAEETRHEVDMNST